MLAFGLGPKTYQGHIVRAFPVLLCHSHKSATWDLTFPSAFYHHQLVEISNVNPQRYSKEDGDH